MSDSEITFTGERYIPTEQGEIRLEHYQRSNALDLNAFLNAAVADPWIKKNIWNNQVWQLAHGYAHLDNRTVSDFDEEELLDLAIEHLGDITYVGFTETFDADCRFIFSKHRFLKLNYFLDDIYSISWRQISS